MGPPPHGEITRGLHF